VSLIFRRTSRRLHRPKTAPSRPDDATQTIGHNKPRTNKTRALMPTILRQGKSDQKRIQHEASSENNTNNPTV